ncbi:MAG: extracellular solute-binding protein [Chloroflexi bacterium]|nr:extracellular solute-binding protein [Chloroflexota bacterium]
MKKTMVIFASLILVLSSFLAGCQTAQEEGTPVGSEQPAVTQEPEEQMGDVIRVLNWQGYGSDEAWAIAQFEEIYGVKVEHDYITSEEEMLTKIRTSPGVYDVVLPNIAYLKIAMDEGLLEPIDTSKLENWDSLMDRFKTLETIRQGDDVYGVPWTWGATAMVYNPEVYPDGLDSMNVFWDPQYAGKIGWWDSYEDSTALVGIAMGDTTPYTPDDLEAVKSKMLELMPNVRTLWTSEDEFDRLWANGDIDLGIFWSGSAARAKNAMDLPMEFVIPKEGGIGWIDTWSIVKDAPNREAAYKFIDYMLSANFYVKWDTEVGAPAPTSQTTLDQLPEGAFNRDVMGNPEVVARLVWMETVPEDARQEWNQMWEEVKSRQ